MKLTYLMIHKAYPTQMNLISILNVYIHFVEESNNSPPHNFGLFILFHKLKKLK